MIQQLIPDDNVTSSTEQYNQDLSISRDSVSSSSSTTQPQSYDSFFYEVKDIQGIPQFLLRERSCQLLLLLLHQRK